MNMSKKKLPTIFERIFLSHLIVLLLTFTAIVLLYFYLIGSDFRIFLKHSPVILVPLSLFLVGIAGLLAAWATRVIVQPLEKTTHAVRSKEEFTFPRFYEEIDELITQIEIHQNNFFFANPALSSRLTKDQMDEIILSLKQSISALAHIIESLAESTDDVIRNEKMLHMKDSIIQLTYTTTRLQSLIEIH